MITANSKSSVQTDEYPSSRGIAARAAHWATLVPELMVAARALADGYLQDERADVNACVSPAHHKAVRDLFAAIDAADRAGVAEACAVLASQQATAPQLVYFVNCPDGGAESLLDLTRENAWLRPGDAIRVAAFHRHALTAADFNVAAAPAATGAQA